MAKPIPACASHGNSRKQPFTAALSESEINAAMQLIQLSSSADCFSDLHHTSHQEDDDTSNNNNNSFFSFSKVGDSVKSIDAASSSNSSSTLTSSSSVAAVLLMEAEAGELGAEEDEERDGDDDDRSNFIGATRKKRYRSIVELYRVTDETVLMSAVVESNKSKKMKEETQLRGY